MIVNYEVEKNLNHWIFIYIEVENFLYNIIDSLKFKMTDKLKKTLTKFN